jgi:hypothetical protein
MDHWIQLIFDNALPGAGQHARNLRLDELGEAEVERDIRTYYEDAFVQIRRDHPDGHDLVNWPAASERERLIEKTGALFVFASTVSRFLSDDRRSPRDKLHEVLGEGDGGVALAPYKFLDGLYLRVLSDSLGDDTHAALIQRVIATVVLAAVPLTVDSLSKIVGKDVHAVIRSLSSVLLVPERSVVAKEPVRTFHPSFHDYLTDRSRCTDARFSVDSSTEHGRLATYCFRQMDITPGTPCMP